MITKVSIFIYVLLAIYRQYRDRDPPSFRSQAAQNRFPLVLVLFPTLLFTLELLSDARFSFFTLQYRKVLLRHQVL